MNRNYKDKENTFIQTVSVILVAGFFAMMLWGCGNPIDYIKNKISAPPTAEEKADINKLRPLPSNYVGECAKNDPALILCKRYATIQDLLDDENVQKFGFKVTVNGRVVHEGLDPAIEYRSLKDGSIERG